MNLREYGEESIAENGCHGLKAPHADLFGSFSRGVFRRKAQAQSRMSAAVSAERECRTVRSEIGWYRDLIRPYVGTDLFIL